MIAKKHSSNKIIYKLDVVPTAQQVIKLYNDADLPRPTHDSRRIRAMFENSDLIVTAWDKNKLVGVSVQLQIGSGAVILPIWLSVPAIKSQGSAKNLSSSPERKSENNQCFYSSQSRRRWITTQKWGLQERTGLLSCIELNSKMQQLLVGMARMTSLQSGLIELS